MNSYFNYLKNEENIVLKEVKSCVNYSVGLFSDGKLYAWGCDIHGQLGINSPNLHSKGLEAANSSLYPTQICR